MQVPLIGFIGRLDYQKGADLVLGAAPWLLNQDVQIVCLGTGDKHLEVMPIFLITLLCQQLTTGLGAYPVPCHSGLTSLHLTSLHLLPIQDFLIDTHFPSVCCIMKAINLKPVVDHCKSLCRQACDGWKVHTQIEHEAGLASMCP